MEVDEAPRLTGRAAGALGGVLEVLVALGVDDDHRLPAQDRLGHQQVEEARLAGAGGPDHEQMPLGVHQRQPHRPLARTQAVNPVRAEARRGPSRQARRAGAQQIVHELGMLPGPVEAPAEPEVPPTADPAREGGRGDERERLAAQAMATAPHPQHAGEPDSGHDQRGGGEVAKRRGVQVPAIGGGPGDRGDREPQSDTDGLVVGSPGVLVAVQLRTPRAP